MSLTPAQMEEFLLRAKIVHTREAGGGVTGSLRATLSDGVLTHAAHIQTIDQARTIFQPQRSPAEFNFRDTHRYNVGGYRLAVLLELDNVPMSVERQVDGKRAAVTWWIDDVLMDERARLKTGERGPDPERTAMQTYIMRVFDELIANRDRNMGNLLVDDGLEDVDDRPHAGLSPREGPAAAERARAHRAVAPEDMRKLTPDAVLTGVGNSLNRSEIQAVLGRRDAIVKLFDDKVRERGEQAVLFTLAR